MAKLDMAKVNTLFKKGYLLAGVMMAANIFTINEVKAMNLSSSSLNNSNTSQNFGEGNQVVPGTQPKQKYNLLFGLLSWEGRINFFGGLFFSAANNYLKLWDYNPGWYRQFGCLGWRSKKFLNGVLQFEVNFINLGRGAFWLLPGIIDFIQYAKGKEDPIILLLRSTAGLITMKILSTNEELCKYPKVSFGFGVSYFIFFILQGFVSMPLTLHLPKINLSISISLDSIIWGITGMILDRKLKNEQKEDEIIKREFSSLYEYEEFRKNNETNDKRENYI